jgi:hypothetical protein
MSNNFFYRILKDEYMRTRFQNIGKDKFPSLLNQLWISDPIGTKTNLIKSFMKAGIFPYNPNSINRSRIIKNNANVDTHTSSITIIPLNDNQTSTTVDTSSQPSNSSFTSSHQAITILNEILDQTKSNNDDVVNLNDDQETDDEGENKDEGEHKNENEDKNEDDDEEEDEEYVPSTSTSTQSSITSFNEKYYQSSSLQQQKKKRKRKGSSIIGFNTSEEHSEIVNVVLLS